MAAAIPAAIGVGGSIISGIQGKGAAKRQERLAQQQLAQLQPLINAQIEGLQFGLGQARRLYDPATSMLTETYDRAKGFSDTAMGDYRKLLDQALSESGELFGAGKGLTDTGKGLLMASMPYLSGAASGLSDLQNFYRPFMEGGMAIDRFLPGAGQVQKLFASDIGNVNEEYRAVSEDLFRAPRGGGRTTAQNRANISRQKGISDVLSKGKQSLLSLNLQNAFNAAGGQSNALNSLMQLGLGQGQLGLGTIGRGLDTIGAGTGILGTKGNLARGSFGDALQALNIGAGAGSNLGQLAQGALSLGSSGGSNLFNMYNQQANRAYPVQQPPEKGLGGFLVDLFSNKSVQDKIGGWFGGGKSPMGGMSLEDFMKD